MASELTKEDLAEMESLGRTAKASGFVRVEVNVDIMIDVISQLAARASEVERLVADLADQMKWNWTRVFSHRDAADAVLRKMAAIGLIDHREHPSGGNVWIVNGKMYGRTDGLEPVSQQEPPHADV